MQKIAYVANGVVHIIHPVVNSNENITEAEALERAKKDIPVGADYIVVNQLPSRATRATWRISNGAVEG